jgi:ABC-type glycerol-3-phosphate transport system substrate-binding protein
MNNWNARHRIHARALIAAALAAVLAACSAQMSTSSTSNVPDPPAPDADLPVIVVTAHPLSPDERAEEGAQMASNVGKSPAATARKARVPSGAPNETG